MKPFYDSGVQEFIPEYMGRIFESICRQYLLRLNINDKLPFLFDSIGRWWGGNPLTKKQCEIDIIASSKTSLIIGECKWQNEKFELSVFNDLKEKAALFAGKEVYFYLFSKSGYKTALIEESKKNKLLTLVGLEDLFNI